MFMISKNNLLSKTKDNIKLTQTNVNNKSIKWNFSLIKIISLLVFLIVIKMINNKSIEFKDKIN